MSKKLNRKAKKELGSISVSTAREVTLMKMSADTTGGKKKGMENFLSETIDQKLDAKVKEQIVTARIAMLLKMPFLGNLATRLKLVNADKWLPTAATDGRHLFYNTKFVSMLNLNQLIFLIGHEIFHVIYEHMDRRNDRQPDIWNVACDFAVNADLIQHRYGEKITQVDICYDPKYAGKTAEEIYNELYKNAEKINMQQLIDKLLDQHLDPEGQKGKGQGDKDKDGKSGGEGEGPAPALSPEERRQIRDEIKEAILQAAQAAGAGNLPAGIKRLLKDLTEPKMNWRELIRQQIESTFKNDFTWMRPSRRGWHMDAVMPGMQTDPMIDVCVSIDMSGSIGEEQARDFLSEIQGIMTQFTNYKLHVWCFDTEIYNPVVFTSDDGEDIDRYEPAGGGGTDFMVNWTWMKENEIEPKKFIMFTDGYPCGQWGDENYCDTLFIVHNGGNKVEAPFGITCQYDQNVD